jgi:hypothetical protein
LALTMFIFSLPYAAVVQEQKTFAGEWNGNWSNNLGEQGPDSLSLSEDTAGNINGLWSGNVPVSGRQVNANTIELKGHTAARSYEITGTIIGNQEMTLKYIVTRLNQGGGSYQGSSRLSLTSSAARSAVAPTLAHAQKVTLACAIDPEHMTLYLTIDTDAKTVTDSSGTYLANITDDAITWYAQWPPNMLNTYNRNTAQYIGWMTEGKYYISCVKTTRPF